MQAQYAYKMEFKPIVLKRLMLDLGLSQSDLAKIFPCSRTTINLAINKGYCPFTIPDFKQRIETHLTGLKAVSEWLRIHNCAMEAIWEIEGSKMKHISPAGTHKKMVETKKIRPIVPGDPEQDTASKHIREEDYMLTQLAKKQFKLFRHPFLNDMEGDGDTFMGEDHRYILEVMKFCSEHGGMVAIIGEVGSGKTAMRRELEKHIRKVGNIRIVFPRIIDKSRATAASLCDAIVSDLTEGTGEKLKQSLEAKSRQVEKHLKSHCRQGMKVVMIIEEAQDLVKNNATIKMLKRFNEIEFEGKKTIAIILVGQTELQSVFDESLNYHMREVIRRFEVAIIRGLNGDLKDYLTHKFKRVGVDVATIITDDAIQALSDRLSVKEGRRKISYAYPLTVNRWIVRAMNEASELGEKIITPEIINAMKGLEAI
jgi:type II secretory pathway predicted ATPase ExeA